MMRATTIGPKRATVLFLAVLMGALNLVAVTAHAAAGEWRSTGSMAVGRQHFGAVLLSNGTVLVTGGYVPETGGALVSAERYDPATGTWSPTGSMAEGRMSHTSTLLPNGKVLIAGGSNESALLATAELYDPDTGTFSSTGSMATDRAGHTSTLLPSGKVLIAGGSSTSSSLATAELYNPATGTFSSTGSMAEGRMSHTSTLLLSGKVLIAGGSSTSAPLATAELYDPGTGTWSASGSMAEARRMHTSTLLPDGQVLVAGGSSTSGPLATAELYDPGTGTWSPTGGMAVPRQLHSATLVSGQVLALGGANDIDEYELATAELYDPGAGTWSATGDMAQGRLWHTATLLPSGEVLVAGGALGPSYFYQTATAELYDPPSVAPPADTDGDGIADGIDDDPATPSTTFTDPIVDGPTTSGAIVSRPSGLSVVLDDAPDPDGVRIRVSGTGTERVVFSMCGGFVLELGAGADVVATCGSITVAVTAGPAVIVLSSDTTVTIPSGVTAKVSDSGGGVFQLSDVSGGDVTVTTEGVSRVVSGDALLSAWDFVGFGSPVDNGGVLNRVKAGRTVPLKWRVLDALGDPVLDVGSAVVRVTSLSCALNTTVDQIEEQATGSSGLQNLGDGYYQLNWKTPSSYANSCKTMKLDLGEGVTRDALFQFTR